jgi:hypothetical protein
MEQSIRIIRRSRAKHEFTFTPVPGFHGHDDMLAIASSLAGSRRMVIRPFVPGDAEGECQELEPFSASELGQFRDLAAPYFGEVLVER